MIRKTVLFSGHVQGVGFRYTTHRLAQRHEVAGYVRNLPDGRVELVVEGERGEVDRLLGAIAERMGGHIRHTQADETAASGAFKSFEIAY